MKPKQITNLHTSLYRRSALKSHNVFAKKSPKTAFDLQQWYLM
jgi:hypothetical protein